MSVLLPIQASQSWSCVQAKDKHVLVTNQYGAQPEIHESQARIQMVSASICGADLRIVSGDKETHTTQTKPVILGHEGCGIIQDICFSHPSTDLQIGDFVVVLPHIHSDRVNGCSRTTSSILASCTSRKHTHHAGWDFDGVFTDSGIFPTTNLVPVMPDYRKRASSNTDIGEAIFTLTEPVLCCLSAYELMKREAQVLDLEIRRPGKALIIGCGPIGMMHGIIASEQGYDVWFADTVPQRELLAQQCLGGGNIVRSTRNPGRFDIVIVTANVLDAIQKAETLVKTNGIIYLFAGLNASDREATHPEGIISYEKVHRAARGVLTIIQDKRILYVGHSGYDASLAPKAVATVATNAARFAKIVTGTLNGWSSSTIQACSENVTDWHTNDGSPAIIPVLEGKADLHRHGKLIIHAGHPA